MHLLEGEGADRAVLGLRPRIVCSDADALEGVEVADFIGDRVLGHRREGAENAYGPGGGTPFGPAECTLAIFMRSLTSLATGRFAPGAARGVCSNKRQQI